MCNQFKGDFCSLLVNYRPIKLDAALNCKIES